MKQHIVKSFRFFCFWYFLNKPVKTKNSLSKIIKRNVHVILKPKPYRRIILKKSIFCHDTYLFFNSSCFYYMFSISRIIWQTLFKLVNYSINEIWNVIKSHIYLSITPFSTLRCLTCNFMKQVLGFHNFHKFIKLGDKICQPWVNIMNEYFLQCHISLKSFANV